jgi:excisionase family DNA binding protein
MSATVEQLLISAKDAATALSISPRKLWSLTNAGQIDFVRIGRTVKYSPDHLREWISKNKNVRKPS